MAVSLHLKYVWLIETIYKAKQITFEEINRKWMDCDLSEGLELPIRTFHKWRVAAEEMYGLVIDCKRKGGYHYYIANADEIKQGGIRNWLLNTASVSNMLINNKQLSDRILLEEIPSGQEYLPVILEAMRNNVTLEVGYRNFSYPDTFFFEVEPYCVKLFKQRWYVIGRTPYKNEIRIYGLDRICHLQLKEDVKFKIPKDFNATDYFNDCIGIIIGDKVDAERVVIKVRAYQANYVRSLPWHHSQHETERNEHYSVFEFWIKPTHDLEREIMWHGQDVEVLHPQHLRNSIKQKLDAMRESYN